MIPFTRWLCFIFGGYPFQLLVYILYPFAHLYWRIFIYEKVTTQSIPAHENLDQRIKDFSGTRLNGAVLDNLDDHGAFTMYGMIRETGLSWLLLMGDFARRVDRPGVYNLDKVSGDVVVAWLFAATHKNVRWEALEWEVRSAAWNYLKNLGSCSHDKLSNGWVSNRCNNFGINYCPDSDFLQLGQPMAGPQFYTSSALFAFASRYSRRWLCVYWLHWLFMGGWYWMWSPVIYTRDKPVFYARDITMKALWVHKWVFGNRYWIKTPMKFIARKISPYRNDLFEAIYGEVFYNHLPDMMNAFFSQKPDATSRIKADEMNPVLGQAIRDLFIQSTSVK